MVKDEELFLLFQNKRSDFALCVQVQELIDKRIKDALGNEGAKFYNQLREISNSINNAGWKDRHAHQIGIINELMGEISDNYEDYLP